MRQLTGNIDKGIVSLFPAILLAALISRLSSRMLVARKKILVAPCPYIKICKASQANIEILQTYKKILLDVRHNGLHNFSTTEPL